MKKLKFVNKLAVIFFCFSISSLAAQELIKLKDLQQIMNAPRQTTVINFWATWCGPCVKEWPSFEKLNQENKKVNVLMVSMDYDLDPNPEKVKQFIKRKKYKSRVVILAEENPSSWIDQVDKNWSGALPATLFIGANGKRKLIEGELTKSELEKSIKQVNE